MEFCHSYMTRTVVTITITIHLSAINYAHALIIIFIPLLCPQQERSTLTIYFSVRKILVQEDVAIQKRDFIVFRSATVTALGG